MPVSPPTKILFLAAGSDDLIRDATLKEYSALQRTAKDHRFDLELWPALKPEELLELLREVKPNVFHFSGHGTEAGELVFADDQNGLHPADPRAIAKVFQELQDLVDVVVLNACHSQRTAEEISKYVKAVVGMRGKLEQQQALAFSKGFYEAFGAGETVGKAFRLALLRAELADVPFFDAPILITRPVKHSRFTHELDRTPHWHKLRIACDERDDHHSFILHGASRQNVELFLTRVLRYFRRPGGRRHRIVSVSSSLDERRATSAADWSLHMRVALSLTDWALHEALEDAARDEAVMFVFCHGSTPLRVSRKHDTIGFNEAELNGFCEFLRDYFPRQLAQARPIHPIRLVVPIEYPDYVGAEPDDPLLRAADAALTAAEGITHERIVEIKQPLWDEIWDSVRAIYESIERRSPPPEVSKACEQAYQLASRRNKTFAELANAIAAELDFDVSARP